MLPKLIRRFVRLTIIVIVVQCSSKVPDQVCNNCNKLAFSVKWGVEDRVLDDDRELKNNTVKSDTECFVECSLDCRCMSFTVCGSSCHLNARSRNLIRGSLLRKPGCRYYDFPAFETECDRYPVTNSPTICCLPSFPLCFNGGICTVNVTDIARRFECICSPGYYGNQCRIKNPRTCLDYWIDSAKPISGKYTIIYQTGEPYEVFCDFDSEKGMAWTLFESFDITHETNLSRKPFIEDFPINARSANWQLFRLPKNVSTDIASLSTFWRATCSYAKYGVDFRDYIRVRLSIMNPLTFIGYFSVSNPCLTVDYIDMKGRNCKGCTQSFFQSKNHPLHIKPRNSRLVRNCTFDSTGIEYACSEKPGCYANIFGLYLKCCSDPETRCGENSKSTTEFWFGAERKVWN